MSDWRELGEIPDSDDESFDSQSTARAPSSIPDGAQPADVWDVPLSGKEVHTAHPHIEVEIGCVDTYSDNSSPLSSIRSDADIEDLHDLVPTKSTESSSATSPTGNEVTQDEISPSFVIGPEIGLFSGQDSQLPSLTNPPTAQRSGNGPFGFSFEDYPEAPYQRSLRPRKPIQEHPYLIEKTNYSNILRRHGVKPIGIATTRSRTETTGDDGDESFDEDSQSTVGLPIADQWAGADDDPFGLAADFLSSSPNKGSDVTDSFAKRPKYARDDIDLPTLDELADQARDTTARTRIETPESAARKRRRLDLIHSDSVEATTSRHTANRKIHTARQESSLDNASLDHEETRQLQAYQLEAPDIIELDTAAPNAADMLDSNDANSEQSSQSDIESEPPEEDEENVLGRIGKRIKGVLPASWIRLDQHAIKKKELDKSLQRRHTGTLLNNENRRGIAQVRRTSKPQFVQPWLGDESDDEVTATVPQTPLLVQDELRFESLANKENDGNHIVLSDDDPSDMELDVFDAMYSASRRQPKSSQMGKRHPKSGSARGLKRQTSLMQKPRQARRSSTKSQAGHNQRRMNKKDKQSRLNTDTYYQAPQLGVLDVIEPDAPRFLKIAARSARRQPNQGRSNLAKKHIILASEQDHSDVLNTLRSWKRGAIQPRASVSEAQKKRSKPRSSSSATQPKAMSKHRTRLVPSSTAPNPTRRMVKRVLSDGRVSFSPSTRADNPMASKSQLPPASVPRHFGPITRPAQMETEAIYKQKRLEFHMRKKALDLVYKRSRTNSRHHQRDNFSEASFERQMLQTWRSTPSDNTDKPVMSVQALKTRKPRKQTRPQHVDIHEPRFRHQLGLSPFEQAPSSAIIAMDNTWDQDKLLGLGSFGTHYSIHFDMYPLLAGTYFHETTLIGSGVIAACSSIGNRLQSDSPPNQTSFKVGHQQFIWNTWNEQTSSELGIILDYAGDHLNVDLSLSAAATGFVRNYVVKQLRLFNELEVKSFTARVTETMGALQERIVTHVATAPITEEYSIWPIFDDMIIIGLCNVEICRQHSMLLSEQMYSENILKAIAKLAISTLNKIDASRMVDAYGRMRDSSIRERGFRTDTPIIHSWVLLIKAFEAASILRGSFWDMAYSALLTPAVMTSMDINVYEQVWRLVFALLPLFEFDKDGILHSDRRYNVSEDGWPIAQSLMKQIFSAYNTNPRQPANFNNYCRAILSRCHTLVRQWGWGNASGIIGAIFDFFGSHNLEHLRNEEVFRSPQFLEDLAASPSLELEYTDKCFHIFLKLLALSIIRLRETGASKDIRNIIARTIPNHNRQYLKEQVIHERDLAALRNHHDLLCTLFWASPPALRPQLTLIENLVTPESSHKEACLINLRAWNQLARFIASNGEVETAFKPFLQWQRTFLQSTLQQFDSIATDIQQQLSAFPKNLAASFNSEAVNNMVLINKRAVSDVLHCMASCSLDVVKHAGNLQAAIYSINIFLLQKVFMHFSRSPPEFEWSVLADVLSILEVFLGYIDVFKTNEDSQPSASQLLDATMGDDALLLLDNDISKSLFSMTRTLITTQAQPGNMSKRGGSRESCTEEATVLAGRLVHRFISGGLITLSAVTAPSTYTLFKRSWLSLNPGEKQYAVLFVSTLLRLGIHDVSELGFTLLQLWSLSIVKPERELSFELQLADQLKANDEQFVPDLSRKQTMNYTLMSDLFEYDVAFMRRSLHTADPSDKKTLAAEYSAVLRLVMEQMKRDLTSLASEEALHVPYVLFVRRIISLIRAHGSEICAVDDFYYQMTKEYSPSIQDPHLQVAGMISYGLRLQDGDSRVGQQLFFFLLNNAKQAIIRDTLGDSINLLRRGFADTNVANFILRYLLPAIIAASLQDASVYPLFDIYAEALDAVYGNLMVAKSVPDSDGITAIFHLIKDGFNNLRQVQRILSGQELHVIRQSVACMNVLWPALFESFLNGLVQSTLQTTATLDQLSATFEEAITYMETNTISRELGVDATRLFGAFGGCTSIDRRQNHQTMSFADHIVKDVDKNWVEMNGKINIQTTVKDAKGVEAPVFDLEVLIKDIELEMREWLRWRDKVYCNTLTIKPIDDNDLIF